MEHADRAGWGELYVMLGTSSAALLGLLFVVTSLHLDQIMNNAVYRMRARSNSIYLLLTLVEAALILMQQPLLLLGLELIALNLFGLVVTSRNAYHLFLHRGPSQRGGMRFHRAAAFIIGFVLGIAGGACLVTGASWGINLVTVSYLLLISTLVSGAWSIMLGVGQSEKRRKR